MANYCEKTTFKKMAASQKAPCVLLINGAHMGAYLGEFVKDGKTYNVTEFSPNEALGGKMRSYVDEYGRRLTHKGGSVIGTWDQCGYLTRFLDYSDWDEATPEPTPQPTPEPVPEEITDLTLALQIYKGAWGNNPEREASITQKYGAAKYKAAQAIVDKIRTAMNYYKTEIRLADKIRNKQWGNNPQRHENITLKYGAHVYRIAQNFVNDLEAGNYTMEELQKAYTVAQGILSGIYGNDPERKNTIVSKYGNTVRKLAQDMVNDVFGQLA